MMFRRDENGEPVVHKHECSAERKGRVMTEQELHDFAVEALMADYTANNGKVTKIEKKVGNEADFRFDNDGSRPNFAVLTPTSHNILVVVEQEGKFDLDSIDKQWLINEYRSNGVYPRVTIASAFCLDTDSPKDLICGADFCFKFYSFSVIPDEANEPLERRLTDVELADKYAQSWREQDASIIEPYLDKDFHYTTDWVFDEMPCRKEFIPYYSAKLKSMKDKGTVCHSAVGRNKFTGRVGIYVNTNDSVYDFILIKCEKGRIINACVKLQQKDFEPFDPEDELYMTHGDHIDAVMEANEFITNHVRDVIANSKLVQSTKTQINIDDMPNKVADVFGLNYSDKDMSMLTLIAANTKHNTNEFISVFPTMKGFDLEVEIERVREWDNQMEATVECSHGAFEFAFFATDYCFNKNSYKKGAKITVNIAAIAMKAEEASHGFDFEGQQAIDHLAKLGEEPEYDENGNVKPIHFDLTRLVAFLALNSKCPEEVEFQSPAGNIEETSLLDIPFYKTTIKVCNHDDTEVYFPLYFRKDFLPNAQKEMPIRGMLWVTGQISSAVPKADGNRLGMIAAQFEEFMNSEEFKSFDDLMFILPHLPLLKLREGYTFDAFKRGNEQGSIIQTYCFKSDFKEYYKPTSNDGLHVPYNDSLKIHGTWDYSETEDVPPALPYFKVPFTEEGIMQAWLLNNISDFMPKFWHANYGVRYYIFLPETLQKLFILPFGTKENSLTAHLTKGRREVEDEVKKFNSCSLLPSIDIDGDHATLRISYWNDWSGLNMISVAIKKSGDTVIFEEPHIENLVKYRCGVTF